MKTYKVEGTVNVKAASGLIIAVRPTHYGEYATHHQAIEQFKKDNDMRARNIEWSVV